MTARWLARLLAKWLLPPRRIHDFAIGNLGDPYLLRWFLVRPNRFCNVYLHAMLKSDDDRVMHDHPWPSLSIMLSGHLIEHYANRPKLKVDRFFPKLRYLHVGRIVFRRPSLAHRLSVPDWSAESGTPGNEVWTLFITGPWVRRWGFWCNSSWRYWRDHMARGCGE